MKSKLMLATGNAHKIAELRAILDQCLAGIGIELLLPPDFYDVTEPVESGATFEENALIKAKYWAEVAGVPALADDSGLVVDALDGAPGVLSARYAATSDLRNERVLKQLLGVIDRRRGARFVCVAAIARPDGSSFCARGIVEGRIAHAPCGEGGFGYDPIFILTDPPHAGRAMAELSPQEKNSISHRARAMAAIAPKIAEILGTSGIGH
jgi:XTP/dITP diphosphohydrolase